MSEQSKYKDKPSYAFNPGPPPEVTRYFRNKDLKPSFHWRDVEPEEHAVAFTVAKAMQLDVLQTIQSALQDAIDNGVPYKQFAQELKPRLQKLGWWGQRGQLDPKDGRIKKVQLGSPRRLRVIYRANLRSARAAGQWDRIQRTKRNLPYLMYLIGPSIRHRPEHVAKEGLVLPVDDPFWQTWYPPNGWNCKCHVRQITRSEAQEHGISDPPETPMREVINKRTGQIKQVPAGIDVGWETNPGLLRQKKAEQFLAGKLDTADPVIARVAARDMASSWRLRRIHEGSAKGAVPVAMLPDDLAKAIGAKTRVVQFSDYTATKTRHKHKDVSADEFIRIAALLENGSVAKEVMPNGTQILIIQNQDDKPWRLVIKRTVKGDELFVSTFHRSTVQRWKNYLDNRNVDILRE